MDSDNKISNSRLFCKRLTVDKFDSTDGLKVDKIIYAVDKDGLDRGRYDKRADFLLLVTGYIVGLVNIWRFPYWTAKNGGVIFVMLYLIFTFLVGLPIVILEMGLGQFTSESCSKVFKCVPVLFGIGWCQVFISFIYMSYHSGLITYAYLYLFSSFTQPLPWSSCNNSFNSRGCFLMNDLITNETMSIASAEFLLRYVLGFQKNDGSYYRFNEYPGAPQWHLSICLFIVWAIACLSILNGVRISGKLAYFTAIFPYFGLLFFFILGCTLPGSTHGLIIYLKPNITKLREPMVYLRAFDQCLLSLGIGFGGLITLSSHNNFHDNFYRDAVFLVVVDCITSIISGLALYPAIGYIRQKSNGTVTRYQNEGLGMYLIVLIEALSTLSGANLWIILFMIMIILLSLDTQFILLETIVTVISDRYVEIHKKQLYRVLIVFSISIFSYLCGLIFITPAGIYYNILVHAIVKNFGLPVVLLVECITIGIVYGHKNFRRDIQMMTGFQLNNYFFISITYICPIMLTIMILINMLTKTQYKPIPIWAKAIACLTLMLIIGPLFIGAIYIIIRYKSRYENCTLEQYLNNLIKPPIYYGPQYKVNWLLDKEYKTKFITNRKDPKFKSHNNQYENVKMIYRAIKQVQLKKPNKSKDIEYLDVFS